MWIASLDVARFSCMYTCVICEKIHIQRDYLTILLFKVCILEYSFNPS